MRQRSYLADGIKTRLWPVPMFGIVVAIVAGIVMPLCDEIINPMMHSSSIDVVVGGGPEAARGILSVIAASLITVTSLTFSLTVVTLQLASSQFSPRLLRTFAGDRLVQGTLALFLATFVYAVMVLRTVGTSTVSNSDGDAEFVPVISITISYGLVLASIVALMTFLAHLVKEIRVESLLYTVRSDALKTVRVSCECRTNSAPYSVPTPPVGAAVLHATATGFLVRIDHVGLFAAAKEANAHVFVNTMLGDWLVEGSPIACVWSTGACVELEDEKLMSLRHAMAASISIGRERTPVNDISYGLGQLNDIALKALSPSMNDPTTAIHALGHSAAILCELLTCQLGPLVLCQQDDDDQDNSESLATVVIRRQNFADLLELVVGQPRCYGASDVAVLLRLCELLREVAWRASCDEDREVISHQLCRVEATAKAQNLDSADLARVASYATNVRHALAGRWS